MVRGGGEGVLLYGICIGGQQHRQSDWSDWFFSAIV